MNPTNQTGKEHKPSREGPTYDRSLRTTAEDNPGAFFDWLGEPHSQKVELLSSSFTAETLHADFVGRAAPDRLVHAEYIKKPSRQAAVKMVAYRTQLMRSHPGCSIKQYALVVADGRLPSVDDPPAGFALGLRTIYLRDCDPAELLAYPSLGGLAVLARGDTKTRVHKIHLEPSMINLIAKETEMTDWTEMSTAEFYSHTNFGQLLIRQGHEQGLAGVLTALLQSRFGDHGQIPAIAEHLAQSSDDDETRIRIINEAGSLDDLAAWLVPAQPNEP